MCGTNSRCSNVKTLSNIFLRTHHMYIKGGISSDPLILWRANDVLEGEGVFETFLLREIEVGVIEVVVDCNEHLPLTGIHHRVVLLAWKRYIT